MGKLVAIGKKVARTPEALAKFHLRQQAETLLRESGLPGIAYVTVKYGSHTAVFEAKPTVNMKTGQIMLHHGGKAPMQFGEIAIDLNNGGNLGLGLGIEDFAQTVARYAPDFAKANGINATAAAEMDDLDEGEETE